MAGFAAFDANGLVLIDERATLFRVALQAGLFVGERLVHHSRTGSHPPSGREGAMGVVAIGAGHEPFVDAMLEGHGKLPADIGVAAITEVSLALGQEKFRNR